MTEQISKIKSKRTTLRTTVTKHCHRIESSLADSDTDIVELEETLEQLSVKAEELKLIDKEIELHLKSDEFEREFQTVEEYSEKITKWIFRARKRITELNPTPKASSCVYDNTNQNQNFKDQIRIRLPKLSLCKFMGDSNHWLTFWNSFETAIHNNESLSKIDKFNYLKAYLGGIAANTIDGLSLSDENYDVAVKLLESRFGRKEILINSHLNNLLNIPPLKTSNDLDKFRMMVDRCQTQIRSLENLGVVSETYGSILCPMLLKLLPNDLVLAYSKIEDPNSGFNISGLIDFLIKELQSREKAKSLMINRTEVNFSPNVSTHDKYQKRNTRQYDALPASSSAANLFTAEVKQKEMNFVCAFCGKPHKSIHCIFANKLTLDERKSILMKNGHCFKCLLRGHVSRLCKNKTIICSKCGYNHASIMCNIQSVPFNRSSKTDLKTNDFTVNTDKLENSDVKFDLNNQSNFTEVYLQTLIVRVAGSNREFFLRTIIDTGSQNSYISKYAAKVLKLNGARETTIRHALFGGMEIPEKHNSYKLKLSNIDKSYSCEIDVLDQKKICSSIPKMQNNECIKELKDRGIYVSDIFEREAARIFEHDPLEIHLLLGSDVAGNLFTGVIEHLPQKNLVAMKTKLGWILMGKALTGKINQENSLSSLSLSLQVSDIKIENLWRLDILGIMDKEEIKSKNILEEETMTHFSNTVKRDKEGRYEIALPWVLNKEILPTNLNLSKKCLDRTVIKLNNCNKREDYNKVFCDWEEKGIIETVGDRETSEDHKHTHYLPHHPVIKETSETTKIRPVFNASARMRNSPSLNDCLTKGPNLIEIIPSILNRFRKYRVGVSSDIEKAFLQISVREEDRDYLRFLWFNEDGKLKTFRHSRVVFGLCVSPFLLAATLDHVFDENKENFEETVKLLRNSFYVDNCLISLNSVEETEKFVEESKKVLSSGYFNLRCWQSNMPNDAITQESTSNIVPVLGMLWNLESDTLTCKIEETPEVDNNVTKRKVLSLTQKVFDPVGYTAPVTLVPKIILQETWHQKLRWDDKLPPTLAKSFNSWYQQLPSLAEIHVPRWLHIDFENEDKVTLHVFCDASKLAYATCAYIRTENSSGISLELVNARSRVAPLKPMTIPRLELLSCLIGARLATTILNDLKIRNLKTFLWSDSSTALAWIKREDQWGTFVHNRVKEIRTLTEPSAWRHVPGKMNPADLPSRGCLADQLLKSRWWEGPQWLRENPEDWPKLEIQPDNDAINTEKRKSVISATNIKQENLEYFNRISTYRKIVRVTAWILRFLRNAKLKTEERKSNELDVDELEQAEKIVLKEVQHQSLGENIRNIQTFKGPDGILRVKSKISYRDDLENFRYPILLPNKHEVVNKLIMQEHIEKNHAGTQTLMSNLRERFWIIKCRKTVRQVIRSCAKCKRFSVRPLQSSSIALPEDRVKDAAVFEVCGTDLCGPLLVKENKKYWIVLFTCAVYRAVHLELVSSLSTDCFILALRRFIARRGRPTIVYSDNGKNLVGTSNSLKAIDWRKIEEYATEKRIRWKFNPPSAPWWGGFWERLIGMVKNALRKVLGRAYLDEEELYTILCDIESTINSRPLTYLSEDPDDLVALSPSMFLQEIKESGVPDLDFIDSRQLKKRFKYRMKVRQDLRNRFRNEYLGLLKDHSRSCKDSPISEGDIVLIGDNNTKRINWPLGKIEKTFPGKDGKIRVAEVKTQTGTFIRPIQRLFHLEVKSPDADLTRRSSYGRALKIPQRFSETV